MTFEYTNPVGDHLAVSATTGSTAVWFRTTPTGTYVPADRVEELVAGIRDTARTATGQTTAQTTVRTPCSEPNPCEDSELCGTHEEEQAHADGEHAFCGATCEVEFPTQMLRNTIIAGGIPGTKGMLDELLRRADQAAAEQPAEAHPADVSWAIEKRGDTDWLMASPHYDTREKALDRLARRRERFPDTEFRLVRETTTWTTEETS